ncbi:glycoside hydrolase [Polaribacter vadi]|uniref:glycoside hydrolase family 113 n=1 Tax=Polaribacter TaxID=52959 RepID=UPI001C0948C3|nr:MULTISPECIES: glycoside hydrolase [Polaribacter]MBU3010876.1 glycoside hydrolase [Polaribacter vadi]MDO6740688.1 glycoside hydrolase [Polaribacter sp. 1_MG-2023]
MKTKILFLVAIVFLQLSCTSQSKKINGLSFVASRDSININHIKPVLKTKGNFVALMPYSFIRNIEIPKIEFNTNREWFGESENGLFQYAKEFKKVGVKIMIKPHLWLRRGGFTGDLKANSEENWVILENSYRNYILTYAKAAENINAEILCIGTELEEFVVNRPEYWQQLIIEIREVYKGKLTYAANWDEYKRLPFWQELDFIGIDAYFPLSEKKSPTVADFELGWKTHKEEISRVQQKNNKPVLFTEFGYRSVDFTGRRPWEFNRMQGSVNLEAQANGLQAIHNQFWKEDWFAGGFVWKWFHRHDKVGGLENNRFTPQNKPAEELLRKLFHK